MYCAEAGPTDVTVQVHRVTGQAPEPNGLSVCFSFNCDCGHYLFFQWSVCVTSTHFVLFAPVFALLSARYRYPSIRFSLRFPPLFCSPNTVFYYTQIIAQSEWVHPPFPLTPTPFPLPLLRCRALLLPPFQIAGLLDTVHTCLVLRCNMCIS